ncbi:MAG: hypothetical protein NDJ19_10735 [Ramlibacter sp.]|nr:hypothetical protein [Ramlibacter sp.]
MNAASNADVAMTANVSSADLLGSFSAAAFAAATALVLIAGSGGAMPSLADADSYRQLAEEPAAPASLHVAGQFYEEKAAAPVEELPAQF